MSRNDSKIIPGAGPFYFEGNKIGVLMIHGGGGGTCADLKPLAEDLHKISSYTIYIPLLPGYGTTPKDLRFVAIDDWKATIRYEIDKLTEKCEKIIVGGHSMGGVLTLILASKILLDGIFTISAPIGIKRFAARLVPFFKLFIKYYSVGKEKFEKETNGKWVGYSKIPLNIATKMKKLIKEMKDTLPKVECPTLLLQGRLDSDIKTQSMDEIYNRINSKDKRKIWLENNDHPILNSPDHQQIVLELNNFIINICN
ncbi:MAG: alpha/beta hydrolase [Candidatus Thorarchaeota archaeon]